MSLRLRFSLFFTLVSFCSLALFSTLIYRQVWENAMTGAEEYLKELTQHESEHLSLPSHQSTEHQDTPHYKNVYLRIWRAKELIYDSHPRESKSDFSPLMHSISTVHQGVPYEITGYYDVSLIHEHLILFRNTLMMGCLLALFAMFPISWFFTQGLLRPFALLAKKTSDLTADQLSFRLPEPKYRDEYGVLARNFNALFVRLEKSFIQLRHFAVSASHEMRTPLSVIISQTENALRNAEKNGHQSQSHLNKILQSAIRLRNIMNQLFVLAEADRLGQENAGSSFEVKETIESALGDLKAVYLDMNKTLSVTHIPEQREFIGNQELFVSVFNNLLENALKYSKSRVEISYAVKSSGLEVCIEDDGPGIPETQRESVFQPFFRGKKSESVVPTSHGLGLTIVQACVRAQQGSIELGESVLGGLSVSVKLPHLSPAR